MKNFITAVFSAALLVSGVTTSAHADEFTYSTHVSTAHPVAKAVEAYLQRVEKDSNMEISHQIFTGGAMAGAKESLAAVRDGLVDAVQIIDAYSAADLPNIVQPTLLMLLGKDPIVMAAASNEFHLLDCPECKTDEENNNFIAMAFGSTSPYYLMCTKPISSLADLQGLRVRATSAMAVLVKNLGAVPVSIAFTEAAEALERGQLDCTVLYIGSLITEGLEDTIKYVLDLPLGTYHGNIIFGMNADRWKGLSASQQNAFIKNLPGLAADVPYEFIQVSEDAKNKALEKGVQFLTPDQKLVDALAELRAKEIDRVAENAPESVQNPKKLLNRFSEVVAKWENIIGNDGSIDKETYQNLLNQEIYSKVQF